MIREIYETIRDLAAISLFALTLFAIAFVVVGYREGILQ